MRSEVCLNTSQIIANVCEIWRPLDGHEHVLAAFRADHGSSEAQTGSNSGIKGCERVRIEDLDDICLGQWYGPSP